MKTLKLGLFSLLAIFAVSVFLISCEQHEAIVPDSIDGVNELNQSIVSDTDAIVFTLPERFDNMSEEELISFFEENSEEDILALATVVNGEIEARGCTSWSSYATATKCEAYCSSNYKLRKKIEWQIRYCFTGPRFRILRTDLGCSCYV